LKLTAEEISELTCGGSVAGIEEVETTITGKTRWSIVKRFVFSKDGEFWAFDFEEGATEYQDGYEPEDTECYRVEAVQVTAYRRVKK
jgi:hypothetical protein